MFSKKQIIILVILILILIGGIFLYRQKYDKWPWQKEVSLVSPTATASPVAPIASPREKTQREKIMEDIASKIAQLSPAQPVLGGQWFVDRFWFVNGSDKDVYVEYEDGHILRRVLLAVSESGGSFKYTVAAYFESGESDWILKSGQDTQFGKNLDLYEYDEKKGEWVKKN